MRKSQFTVKLLLLTLILGITLINLSQTVQAWWDNCHEPSFYCYRETLETCEQYCEGQGSYCDHCWLDYYYCSMSLCHQYWAWRCGNGHYDYEDVCYAFDKVCPL